MFEQKVMIVRLCVSCSLFTVDLFDIARREAGVLNLSE